MHGEAQDINHLFRVRIFKRRRGAGTSVIEAHKVDVIGIHESSQILIVDVEEIGF